METKPQVKPCTIYHWKIETKNCHLSTYNISKHFSVFVLRLALCPANSLSSFLFIPLNDCDMMWDDVDWSDTDDGGGDIVMRANDKCSKCLVKGRIHYHVTVDISSLMSRHNTNNIAITDLHYQESWSFIPHLDSCAELCGAPLVINCDNYKVVSHLMFHWQRE